MIGKNIRGFRHLTRIAEDLDYTNVVLKHTEYGYVVGKMIPVTLRQNGQYLFYFNNKYGSAATKMVEELDFLPIHTQEMLRSAASQYERLSFYEKMGIQEYFEKMVREIIVLPNNFDESFSRFIKENNKMLRQLEHNYGIEQHSSQLALLYILSSGSKNFVQWGAHALGNSAASILTFKKIMQWNDNFSQLVKKLSKGSITAYNTKDDIQLLLEEMRALTRDKRVKDTINSFNTIQKKVLRENDKTDADITALATFARLSKMKQNNFIRKVSSVTDYNELIKQIRFVTNTHFEWNKESFMAYLNNVENLHYSLIYEKDDVVLVEVKDFDTVKRLAKMTNWCISKNKSYWNQYMETNNGHKAQYILFNFAKKEDDKYSIVGFTSRDNKGITHAHDYVNNNIMPYAKNTIHSQLNSYLLEQGAKKSTIFSLLDACQIDVSLVVKFDAPKYLWNPHDTLDYLYSIVPQNQVTILCNQNNKIAVSLTDSNITQFFGDVYKENISEDWAEMQHILFFDFNLKPYDPNKVQFAIINYHYESEDECIGLYNERCELTSLDCDDKLDEYGLPYAVIRRIDNTKKRFAKDFLNLKYNRVKDALSQDKTLLRVSLENQYLSQASIQREIRNTIINYISFDYLHLVYSVYPNLTSCIGAKQTNALIQMLFNSICTIERNHDHTRYLILNKPTEKDIQEFYKRNINSLDDVKSIGIFLALKTILEHESKTNKFFEYICDTVAMFERHGIEGTLCQWVIDLALDNCTLGASNAEKSKWFIDYVGQHCKNKYQKVLECLPKGSVVYKYANKLFGTRKSSQKEALILSVDEASKTNIVMPGITIDSRFAVFGVNSNHN